MEHQAPTSQWYADIKSRKWSTSTVVILSSLLILAIFVIIWLIFSKDTESCPMKYELYTDPRVKQEYKYHNPDTITVSPPPQKTNDVESRSTELPIPVIIPSETDDSHVTYQ